MTAAVQTRGRSDALAGNRGRLSVRDVAVARNGRRIVEGVSFDLDAGEAIILKGQNGSGKTTLLRAIAGLSAIDSGAIGAPGEASLSPAARRERIALCGHADAVKSQLTVRENISFWRRLYSAAPERTDAALAAFDLEPQAEILAANLSAGQRRRLSLSRLIVAAKPIWLLDEPTASVDTTHSARIESLVSAHLAAGGAAIVATHDRFSVPNARSFVLGARAP